MRISVTDKHSALAAEEEGEGGKSAVWQTALAGKGSSHLGKVIGTRVADGDSGLTDEGVGGRGPSIAKYRGQNLLYRVGSG